MKTRAPIFSKHHSRVRFYDRIPADDEGHPVDLVVQRWMQHEEAQRRILNLQEQMLAVLDPGLQREFLKLEELRNEVAAEREEAYFDLGVGHGIERERQQRRRRLRSLPPAAAKLAARVRRCLERTDLEQHEVVFALVEVLAEYTALLAEFRAEGRKSR